MSKLGDWYYTFGVNCANKFTQSHAHLFHFVKDPSWFTFHGDRPENRIPSARQFVYGDSRANPKGRLPDDTWLIRPAGTAGEFVDDDSPGPLVPVLPPADPDQTFVLRPQDLGASFRPRGYVVFPEGCWNFKERAGFHGCQMPEQLLGRIIRSCSNEGDLVLDPFSGGASTLIVAKKLGRRYMGFDLSSDYVAYGLKRLQRSMLEIRWKVPLNPCWALRQRGQARSELRKEPASAVRTRGSRIVKRPTIGTATGRSS